LGRQAFDAAKLPVALFSGGAGSSDKPANGRHVIFRAVMVFGILINMSAAQAADTGALRARAVTAEREGRRAEAAAAYEELLRLDETSAGVVAPRLVDLYVAEGRPVPALAWAFRVAPKQPDAQAYLAGVYARLGQWTEAALLLGPAAREATNAARRVSLLWQLAEAQTGGGRAREAVATLESAAQAADANAVLRRATERRLVALRARVAADRAAREKEAQP
jgi:tetratricopeptide (TPR) repeat protein